MAECKTPDLGRIKGVALALLDDCLAPIYGTDAVYFDDCPAAVETSDNVDDGEEFTRRCADGSIKVHLPGVRSLQSIEVNVDFHWLDPNWVAQAGGAKPILHDGEVIGWSDTTQDRFNVAVIIWQEIIGESACAEGGAGNYVRIYPLKGARLSEEGSPGAEDNFIRLIGLTQDKHELGSGPLPLAAAADGSSEWLTNCIPRGHRFRFVGGAMPEECGTIDTVAPTVPCEPNPDES